MEPNENSSVSGGEDPSEVKSVPAPSRYREFEVLRRLSAAAQQRVSGSRSNEKHNQEARWVLNQFTI